MVKYYHVCCKNKSVGEKSYVTGKNDSLRIGPSGKNGKDYHLMKRMSNGTWTHKPGNTCVLKLKGNPWDYTPWKTEGTGNGSRIWEKYPNTYYDGDIKYIKYWK